MHTSHVRHCGSASQLCQLQRNLSEKKKCFREHWEQRFGSWQRWQYFDVGGMIKCSWRLNLGARQNAFEMLSPITWFGFQTLPIITIVALNLSFSSAWHEPCAFKSCDSVCYHSCWLPFAIKPVNSCEASSFMCVQSRMPSTFLFVLQFENVVTISVLNVGSLPFDCAGSQKAVQSKPWGHECYAYPQTELVP